MSRGTKVLALVLGLAVAAGIAVNASGVFERPQDDRSHPDHTRVFNGFQDATRSITGGEASSVPPESECKQIDGTTWRCYRQWAPVGDPAAVEVIQADVNIYETRIVVGPASRTAATP